MLLHHGLAISGKNFEISDFAEGWNAGNFRLARVSADYEEYTDVKKQRNPGAPI
jgi:hypothetical protein